MNDCVWVIISRQQGIFGVYTKEEVAQFVCDKLDSRVATNPKVKCMPLTKSLSDAGYSIYDRKGPHSIYKKEIKN